MPNPFELLCEDAVVICKGGGSEEQRTGGIGKDSWEQGSRLTRYRMTVQFIYEKQS